MLKNHKNLSYLDACFALAYGYFKREAHVEIFHWVTEKLSVQKIPIDKQATDEDNYAKFNAVQVSLSNQKMKLIFLCYLIINQSIIFMFIFSFA